MWHLAPCWPKGRLNCHLKWRASRSVNSDLLCCWLGIFMIMNGCEKKIRELDYGLSECIFTMKMVWTAMGARIIPFSWPFWLYVQQKCILRNMLIIISKWNMKWNMKTKYYLNITFNSQKEFHIATTHMPMTCFCYSPRFWIRSCWKRRSSGRKM